MTDLRAELLGGTGARSLVPPYRMLIPAGWQAYDMSVEDESALTGAATARLRSAGRADLAAGLTRQVQDALASLRQQKAFCYALAGEASPTWVLGSASLIGTRRDATPELPLDAIVQNAVTAHGGAPLGGDERFVRWTERRTATIDGEVVATTMLNYMTPIPGSRRTQAVHWVVNVAHAPELAEDDPALMAWNLLFDTHVASFTWVR